MRYMPIVVSISDCFDRVGQLTLKDNWSAPITDAANLGRRSDHDEKTWQRGKQIRATVLQLIEDKRIPIIFELNGSCVQYGEVAAGRITNIFPSPTGGPVRGMIELNDQDIFEARADIGWLPLPRSSSEQKRGPKRQFNPFSKMCEDFFRNNPLTMRNADVRRHAKSEHPNILQPGSTRTDELINEAREIVRIEMAGN